MTNASVPPRRGLRSPEHAVWVDNGGEPSADHIVPEWQTLEVGQHLQRPPNAPSNWWTVMILEANRTLVLHASYDFFGKGVDTRTGLVPWASTEGTWGFYLRETQDGQTRLVVRTRTRSRPQLLQRPFTVLVGEPVHFTMRARQFHNPSSSNQLRRVAAQVAAAFTELSVLRCA